METKKLADKMAGKYGTRDPFRITSELNYIVLETHLAGIRGYYQYARRCHIIYLSDSLTEHERIFVCAHELGHSLLHKDMNRIFMDTRTNMVTSRFEIEANHFAVDLIYSDDVLREYIGFSNDCIAKNLGMSNELAEYRMKNIQIL